jgi:adenylylsulfate kinase
MARVFWFTGLACSGKTTLAKELCNRIDAELFDGDEVRQTPLTTEGFSSKDREKHLLRLAYIAKRFVDRGINVVVSCISPIERVRKQVRAMFDEGEYLEIYLNTPLEVCKGRDVKGMYKMAEAGHIEGFTGVNSGYDTPENPDITLDTSDLSLEVCINQIIPETDKRETVLFIGRFMPFHLGHKEIIDRELLTFNRVCVCIKFDRTDESNPYTPDRIKKMIRRLYGNRVDICVVPNFKDIVQGREVGYGVRKISLDGTLEDISGTRIRGLMDCGLNISKYKIIPKEIEDLI